MTDENNRHTKFNENLLCNYLFASNASTPEDIAEVINDPTEENRVFCFGDLRWRPYPSEPENTITSDPISNNSTVIYTIKASNYDSANNSYILTTTRTNNTNDTIVINKPIKSATLQDILSKAQLIRAALDLDSSS